MAILIFSPEMRREEHRVRYILEELEQEAEVYRSLERLHNRFQRPRGDLCLMIFVIGNHTILNHLILMKDQMYDLPIALILPEADREIIMKGHKFYPRFITFADSDYSDLTLALQNIIQRECEVFNETERVAEWSSRRLGD